MTRDQALIRGLGNQGHTKEGHYDGHCACQTEILSCQLSAYWPLDLGGYPYYFQIPMAKVMLEIQGLH